MSSLIPVHAVSYISTAQSLMDAPTATVPFSKTYVPQFFSGGSQNTRDQVTQKVQALNDFVSAHRSEIRFEIDKSNGLRVVTKIIDVSTQEVLRQMPSEEVLRLAKVLENAGPREDVFFSLVQSVA